MTFIFFCYLVFIHWHSTLWHSLHFG